jgi:hypothetical protein
MKKTFILALLLICGTHTAFAQMATHRLGAGVNYWVTLEDIEIDDVDSDGLSYLATYQFRPGLLGVQVDFEWLPDRFGDKAYAPAAYLVFGRGFYAALGAGIVRQDGEWADDPFVALKAGVDLALLQNLYIDLGVSYRFDSSIKVSDALDDIDTDTIYVGGAVRLAF